MKRDWPRIAFYWIIGGIGFIGIFEQLYDFVMLPVLIGYAVVVVGSMDGRAFNRNPLSHIFTVMMVSAGLCLWAMIIGMVLALILSKIVKLFT